MLGIVGQVEKSSDSSKLFLFIFLLLSFVIVSFLMWQSFSTSFLVVFDEFASRS
ncbi:sortase B protein-sorting domain-containing protein [Pseudoalteromonas neustonica]|uniref:sortase B protein-sorting domain-containing protein n=1 Tax=Pseudoalteromonas neustonica TaxID=1840331 RepID=UPI0039658601